MSASARPSTSKALNLVRSGVEAPPLLLEPVGNGSDKLDDWLFLSLVGKLRLRRKSAGMVELDPGSFSLSTPESALAAGVGGTPSRPIRNPSGKAVVMPPSGKSLAQGCGSTSLESARLALGRDCRRAPDVETSGVASAKGLAMRVVPRLGAFVSGTWTVAK